MTSQRTAQVKKNFFEDNTEFTEISAATVSAMKGFQNVDEDEEEVWLLQCPKGLDVQNLEGHKLKFPGRVKIKEFEATALGTTTPETMAFGYNRKNNYHVKLLPVTGKIVLREQLSAPQNITEANILESCPATTVPMPEYIKLRHPLLGANFDEYLKFPANRNSGISNENRKRPIKQEKSPKKRTQSIVANEGSNKKSKSIQQEKRRKVRANSPDVSDDLKWIKEL